MRRLTVIYFSTLGLLLPSLHLVHAKLENPLGDDVTVPILIGRVIRALLGVSGALALLMFVIGGMRWLLSQGAPEKIKSGRDTLIWSAVGLGVIFTAYSLVNFVIDTIVK
jgi:hypothetical protein